MPITLGSNIASLRAQNALSKATASLSKSFERLSSGLRINSPADDPAGLSLSTKLNADARVFTTGMRNVSDSVSLLNVANGAVNELNNIVFRLRELAEQAANGAITVRQRAALDEEFQALKDEYARITEATKFNGISLLSAPLTITTQAAYSQISFSLGSQNRVVMTAGDGSLGPASTFTGVEGIGPRLGDFNNDGYDDIFIMNTDNSRVNVMLSNGDGTYRLAVSEPLSSIGGEGAIGDLNGDGNLDFIAPGISEYTVYLGHGDGTFDSGATYAVTGSGDHANVILEDFNNDGVLDIMTASDADARVNVYIGNGNGTFRARVSMVIPEAITDARAYSGDFNGDGNQDIVSFDSYTSVGSIYIYMGNGNGTFTAATAYAGWGQPGRFEIADLNGDGYDDLIATDNGAGVFRVSFANSNGTFAAPISYNPGVASLSDLKLADMNTDGRLDLVVTGFGSGRVRVNLGNGNGTFSIGTSYSVALGDDTLTIGDVNGDGAKDVVSSSFLSGVWATHTLLGGTATTAFDTETILEEMDIATITSARLSLGNLAPVQNALSSELGAIGASMSRFEIAFDNMAATRDEYLAAAGRILDADVAAEAAEMVRLQILQQAATAILAQANQQPAITLQLLSVRNA